MDGRRSTATTQHNTIQSSQYVCKLNGLYSDLFSYWIWSILYLQFTKKNVSNKIIISGLRKDIMGCGGYLFYGLLLLYYLNGDLEIKKNFEIDFIFQIKRFDI